MTRIPPAVLYLAACAALWAGCAHHTPADGLRKPDLVEITSLDPAIRLDIRYATPRNFTGRPLYPEARAFLQRPAAEALARVNASLREKGCGLLVFDGYRPWHVTKLFWDMTPEAERKYVADPHGGSIHNVGCAVDLTLYDLATGKEVVMPSAFDERGPSAAADYRGGPEEARRMRDMLRRAMEAEGFTVYRREWWHFNYRDWDKYPVLDIPFENIAPAGR